MNKKRIVVTGIGIESPIGSGENFFNNIKAGSSSFSKYIDSYGDIWTVSSIKNLSSLSKFPKYVNLGLSSSIQAVKDSRLNIDNVQLDRIGMCFGLVLFLPII